MRHEEKLYGLVADSVRHPISREKLLAMAFRAILDGGLRVRLPDDVSLDTPVHLGRTWRHLIAGDLAALENSGAILHHFPRSYNSITVDATVFNAWLRQKHCTLITAAERSAYKARLAKYRAEHDRDPPLQATKNDPDGDREWGKENSISRTKIDQLRDEHFITRRGRPKTQTQSA